MQRSLRDFQRLHRRDHPGTYAQPRLRSPAAQRPQQREEAARLSELVRSARTRFIRHSGVHQIRGRQSAVRQEAVLQGRGSSAGRHPQRRQLPQLLQQEPSGGRDCL